jgi:lipopolysaccharide export system protein LptA
MTLRILLAVMILCGAAMAEEQQKAATKITADRLDFDYKRMVAVFSGNVVAVDPDVKIAADKVTMAFGEDQEIKLVTCSGNVRIWYQDKTASARQAVYQAKKGEVELLGEAKLARGNDTVQGDRILFNMFDETMVCEPGYLIVTPGDKKDNGLNQVLGPSTKK